MGVSFGGTAYVSYSRRDEENHQIVTQLQDAFSAEWVDLKVDINEIGERESFNKFIADIGEANCVVVIFSDNYFESFFCMLELANMLSQGNAIDRIYPVFAEQSYRFDGSKQRWLQHWTDIRDDWFGVSAASNRDGVFGTEAECNFILEQLESTALVEDEEVSFFEFFGRTLAGTVPSCNDNLINWVKETYFERVKNSPVFGESINYLSQCSESTKSDLRRRLPEEINDEAGEQIAYLCKLPLPELIDLFWRLSQQIKQFPASDGASRDSLLELSRLLRKLLPVLFCPSDVPKFRDQCDQEIGIIEIPHTTVLSAEILMAGADHREADFYTKVESHGPELVPGRYNLRLPPESGSSSPISEIEDDLSNQLGIMGKEISDIFDECESHLANTFARLQSGRAYSNESKRKFTQQRFKQMRRREEPRYYWILLMGNVVSRQRWQDISRFIGETYPEIAIIMLSEDIDLELSENDMFDLLHAIIPANKPTSNHS